MTDKELYEVLKRADNANTIINTLHTERIDYHSEYVPLIESNQDILRLHDEIERLKKEIFKYKKEIFKYKKEIFKYKEEAAKYKAERDKAVEDLADVADCIICKYDDVCENSNSQGCCNGNWQWRGLEDKL
jgi:predicted RNase H-like nuclease (RuvC/YqgF family)